MTVKLSDFTHDQLSLTAKTLILKRQDLIEHVDQMKATPELERMFEKEILEWQSQIDDLETLIAQFTYAAAQKEFELRILWN